MYDDDDNEHDDDIEYISYREYLKREIKADFQGWPWYKVVAYFAGIILIGVGGWFALVMLFAAFG